MNKLISKIVGVALGLTLAVGTGVAVAANNSIAPALAADQYVETAFASLATGDVGVIVGNNGDYFALSNNNGTGSAPTATSVGVSSGKLSAAPAATLLWQVIVNSGSYQFTVYGGSNKLYCTNSNNGVRVGTNSNNAFTLDGGYLKNTATSRYVGIYNSQDWRCYTASGGNIANQSFAFYKKTADTSGETIAVQSVTMSSASATVKVGKTVTLSATISPDNATCSLTSWLSSDASVATVSNGTVNGVAAGSATITAFADENNNGTLDSSEKRDTCTVTVQDIQTINSNVADALVEAGKLASGETSGDLYCVTGYVVSV